MGLDLRLLPCESWLDQQNGRVWGFSHTILNLGSIGDFEWHSFQKLVKPHLAGMPVGHNVASFIGARIPDGHHKDETTYGTIRDKDAYGETYKVVEACHLLPWLIENFLYDGASGGPYQASIVAYVRALPAATKIVLDWH